MGILGYSLGGFLALMTAADDERLRVIALAAAGDLPDATPYASMVRALVDPPRAARKLRGRPLLLVNGRLDSTTRPAAGRATLRRRRGAEDDAVVQRRSLATGRVHRGRGGLAASELDLLAQDTAADSERRTS